MRWLKKWNYIILLLGKKEGRKKGKKEVIKKRSRKGRKTKEGESKRERRKEKEGRQKWRKWGKKEGRKERRNLLRYHDLPLHIQKNPWKNMLCEILHSFIYLSNIRKQKTLIEQLPHTGSNAKKYQIWKN